MVRYRTGEGREQGGNVTLRNSIAAIFVCGFLAVSPARSQQANTSEFNNDSVVTLTSAGIGDDVLSAKINSLPCSYDVSTDQLILLKTKGVSNAIIATMVERCTGATKAQGALADNFPPTVKRTPGIYMDLGQGGTHNIRVIRPTIASGGRVTGNGSLLFPFTTKLSIPRDSAQTAAPAGQPKFYFYFETDNQKVSDFGMSASISAQSPAEFSLIKLKVDNGQREIIVGKVSAFGGRMGINSKHAINFSIAELGDGIFAVQPETVLSAGEYAFALKMGDTGYRLYDFHVQ